MQIVKAVNCKSVGTLELEVARDLAEVLRREVIAVIKTDIAEILQRESKDVVASLRLDVDQVLRRLRAPRNKGSFKLKDLEPTKTSFARASEVADRESKEIVTIKNMTGQEEVPKQNIMYCISSCSPNADKTAELATEHVNGFDNNVDDVQYGDGINGSSHLPRLAALQARCSKGGASHPPSFAVSSVCDTAAAMPTGHRRRSCVSPMSVSSPASPVDEPHSAGNLKLTTRATRPSIVGSGSSSNGVLSVDSQQQLAQAPSPGPRFLLSEPGPSQAIRRRPASTTPTLTPPPQSLLGHIHQKSGVAADETRSLSLPRPKSASVDAGGKSPAGSASLSMGVDSQRMLTEKITVASRQQRRNCQVFSVTQVTGGLRIVSPVPAALTLSKTGFEERELCNSASESAAAGPGRAAANRRSGYWI